MEVEIFTTALTFSVLLMLLAGVVLVVIINYKRRQQEFILEKKMMREMFDRQLLEAKMEMQETTLAALSNELHDNVGQLLTSVRMLLGVAGRSLEVIPAAFTKAEETLAQTMSEVRTLSKSLDRNWLRNFNLLENLRREVRRSSNASLTINLSTAKDELPITSEEQLLLFRIIQEAMQNAVKHAAPSQIDITILMGDTLRVSIANNGKGMDSELPGMGISNMKERVALLQGSIAWDRYAPSGTIVTIELPLKS